LPFARTATFCLIFTLAFDAKQMLTEESKAAGHQQALLFTLASKICSYFYSCI
jgi:hypothetical protein